MPHLLSEMVWEWGGKGERYSGQVRTKALSANLVRAELRAEEHRRRGLFSFLSNSV